MLVRHQEFIKYKTYLQNVSPATLRWYTHAFNWLPVESPTQDELNSVVVRMREAGLKATGTNAVIRALNCYLHWNSGSTAKCGAGCTHPHIRPLKEPQFVPVIFDVEQVGKLIVFSGRRFFERRLHLLCCTLFDTGARISEVTSLRIENIDLDNLLLKLDGKGRKQRVVPFSLELRRVLYKYIKDFKPKFFLLANRDGSEFGRGSALHGVKRLCRRLGFEPPARTLHAFRHTFATNYLRRGGNVFLLQKSLGHTSLDMSRRYAHLQTEDLQAAHAQISLLGSAR